MFDFVATTPLSKKTETLQPTFFLSSSSSSSSSSTCDARSYELRKCIINICNFQLSFLGHIAGSYSTDVIRFNGILRCCEFHKPKTRMKSKLNELYHKINIKFYNDKQQDKKLKT